MNSVYIRQMSMWSHDHKPDGFSWDVILKRHWLLSDQVCQNRFATSARPHNANLQIAIRHSPRRQKTRTDTTIIDDRNGRRFCIVH